MEKSEIQKEIQKLYQKYLEERLGLIIDIANDMEEKQNIPKKETKDSEKLNAYQVYQMIQKKKKDDIDRMKEESQNGKKTSSSTLPKQTSRIYASNFFMSFYEYNFIDENGQIISDEWFQYPSEFSEGYARVWFTGKGYNYIDVQGRKINDQWYDSCEDFHEGFARVEKDRHYSNSKNEMISKSNFINTKGQLICYHWFDKARNFSEGYAVVYLNGRGYNYIDTTGALISNQWYESAEDFHEGYARIKKDNKYNYIDTQGRLISDQWYESAEDFHEGYAKVEIYKKGWNFIDTKGQILSPDLWFDFISDFFDGYASIRKGDTKNYIDTQGHIISPDLWFDDVWDFHEGYAKIYVKGKGYNYIDTKGQLISDEWCYDIANLEFEDGYAGFSIDGKANFVDENRRLLSPNLWFNMVWGFNCGCAKVWITKKGFNYVNTKGELVSNQWFTKAEDFHEGYAVVNIEGKGWNYIDNNGQMLSPNLWFDQADSFHEGYAKVWISDKGFNYINTKGQLMSDIPIYNKDFEIINESCIKIGAEYTCVSKNTGDYQAKKGLINYRYVDENQKVKVGIKNGYKCWNDKDRFHVIYEPIRMYGVRFVLCLDKDKVILYDRENLNYQTLGTISDIEFNDNIIHDMKNNKVYFMYDNKKIEITEYYQRHELSKQKYNIKQGLSILSMDDFTNQKEEEIQRLMEEEKRKDKKKAEREELKKAQELEEQQRKVQEENKKAQKEALKELRDVLEEVSEARKNGDRKKRMPLKEENLYITVEDHKEINPFYIEKGLLRYIDLMHERFENVKVEGIDFRGCNINLRPQLVYEKSLRNCNLEGIYIGPFMNFTGVDIRGCKFSDDNDPMTLDRQNIHFKDAIYDETTTYNGEPLTKIFGECKHKKAKNSKL